MWFFLCPKNTYLKYSDAISRAVKNGIPAFGLFLQRDIGIAFFIAIKLNAETNQMETKTAIIRIEEKSKFEITYSTLEDLSYQIFDRLFEMELTQEHGSVTVEFEPSKIVNWDFCMAHYCFAKGRLSESDFVKIVFYGETLGKEDAK